MIAYFKNSNNSRERMDAKLPAISKSTMECWVLESFRYAMCLKKGSLRCFQNLGL